MELHFPSTAASLGAFLSAEIQGDLQAGVDCLTSLEASRCGGLCFLEDSKGRDNLLGKTGAVVLTRLETIDRTLPVTFVIVKHPKAAFAKVAQQLKNSRPPRWTGISPQAFVHPDASLAKGVVVAPFAYIGAKASVGVNSLIEPYAYVADHVQVGDECEISAHVVLEVGVKLGHRVKVLAGTVIGSEGFNLVPGSSGKIIEMPHLGTVRIEDDVRIGANCTIDRALFGETVIGAGSKLDDHVHIAHNVQIGRSCILCGQVGVAGSSVLEDGVVLAGQVGVKDHVRIGSGAKVGAQSGVSQDLRGGEHYFGSPALAKSEAFRFLKLMRRLPQLWKRVEALEMHLKGQND